MTATVYNTATDSPLGASGLHHQTSHGSVASALSPTINSFAIVGSGGSLAGSQRVTFNPSSMA